MHITETIIMNNHVELELPDGVNPASYITVPSEHGGITCELCDEEQHTVPQLALPVKGHNRRGNRYCRHTYTPSRGAYFYWNADGTTFVRRVDGRGAFTFAHGWVKRYGRGRFAPPDGVPFLNINIAGRGQLRALCEEYYEALFQRYHPRARWDA